MKRSPGCILVAIVLVLIVRPAAVPQESSGPSGGPDRDRRMAWWREARFGMFIHWGLYAVPAGVWNGKPVPGIGEWIMFNARIPVADYEPLAKRFDPVRFDAKAWVGMARDAGMKYIVITSKHHDGFCLFDSKLTDYDVVDATPFKRDILAELAAECRKQGLKMCFYHSILDWHHPDYLPRGTKNARPWDTRPTDGGDAATDASRHGGEQRAASASGTGNAARFDRYLEYMRGQLRELLTKYGDVGVLWFDGGWEHSAEELRSREIVAMLRSLQPNLIVNDRLNVPEDFDTPEQYIPATGIPGRDWETCMTMNDTWGYKAADQNWKSEEDLIRKLVDVASKGGNFLLNVGPTAEGTFPEPIVDRLLAFGRWMKLNAESIHGTKASPFRRLAFGRCTRKAGRLFLHVFDWPKGALEVPGLETDVKKAWLLGDPARSALRVTRSEGVTRIEVPAEAPDRIDSVLVLEIEGDPAVDNAIRPGPDGIVRLLAADATVHGSHARYESGGGKDDIGTWTDARDSVGFEFRGAGKGRYRVAVTFACEKGSGEGEYTVSIGTSRLSGKVHETGSWTSFVTETLGEMELPPGDVQVLEVRPVAIPKGALMNLKSIVLTPAEK